MVEKGKRFQKIYWTNLFSSIFHKEGLVIFQTFTNKNGKIGIHHTFLRHREIPQSQIPQSQIPQSEIPQSEIPQSEIPK